MHQADDPVTPRIADLDSDTRGVRVDEWMRQRGRARWRGARTALVVLALLITVVAFLRVSWSAGRVPAPNTTLQGNTAIIDTNVTYGTLHVDGATYAMHPWLHIALRTGANHLTLNAPPFNPIHCTLAAPLHAGDDRCGTGYSVYEQGGYVQVVTLAVGEGDLSATAQQTVQSDLAHSLTNIVAQTTLGAGEWYGTGVFTRDNMPQLRRTTAPALAQLRATLNTSNTLPCGTLICPITLGAATLPQASAFWQIQVPVNMAWTITDAQTGQMHTYPLLTPNTSFGDDASNVLTMDAFFDGRDWTFSDVAQNSKVLSPMMQLAELACEAGASILESKAPGIVSFAPGTTGRAGCALIFTNNTAGSNAKATIAHFIVRVGALLATDAAAQQLLPGVPLATPEEIAAVGAGS
jgi:hypothetical protein